MAQTARRHPDPADPGPRSRARPAAGGAAAVAELLAAEFGWTTELAAEQADAFAERGRAELVRPACQKELPVTAGRRAPA